MLFFILRGIIDPPNLAGVKLTSFQQDLAIIPRGSRGSRQRNVYADHFIYFWHDIRHLRGSRPRARLHPVRFATFWGGPTRDCRSLFATPFRWGGGGGGGGQGGGGAGLTPACTTPAGDATKAWQEFIPFSMAHTPLKMTIFPPSSCRGPGMGGIIAL